MPLLTTMFVALGLGTGRTAAQPPEPGSTRMAPKDSIVEFLLTSAANDFFAHHPPDPAKFRRVRFAYLLTATGEKVYMLCGEFLPKQNQDKPQWIPFATIKTSGYEQWLGGEATGYCENTSRIWINMGDLSASLQDRLDFLRRGGGPPP